MGDKPTKKGFLGFFGLGKGSVSPEASVDKPPVVPPQAPPPVAPLPVEPPPSVKVPLVRSEAYQSRRKGRKLHEGSLANLTSILACIQRRGVATPSQLAEELGMPRSTLTYYLKRFIDHEPGYYYSWNTRFLRLHLDGKRLERLGKGSSVRYRIVPETPEKDGESPEVG